MDQDTALQTTVMGKNDRSGTAQGALRDQLVYQVGLAILSEHADIRGNESSRAF